MATIITDRGEKPLWDVNNPDVEIRNGERYRQLTEGGVVLLQKWDSYICLKKINVTSADAVVPEEGSQEAEGAETSENDEFDAAFQAYRDWAEAINRQRVRGEDMSPRMLEILAWKRFPKAGWSELYMHIEDVEYIPGPQNKESVRGIIRDGIALCGLLEKFREVSGRQHCNLSHFNVFKSPAGVLLLGNSTLRGEKNDVPYYTAPEILQGRNNCDRADVYCLGMWLYEMLYAGNLHVFRVDQDRTDGARIELKSYVPRGMENVLKKALQPDPAKRYAGPAELSRDLERLLRPPVKIPWKGIAVAAAGVFAAAGIGFAVRGYDPGAGRIRSMITAKNFTLAYEELASRDPGEKTDTLIRLYIDGCLADFDYQRAAEIIPMFSQAMFDEPEYLGGIMDRYASAGKLKVLEPTLDRIGGRSAEVDRLIDRVRAYGS